MELKSLWDQSTSSSQEVACAACDALVSLVQQGVLCFNYVLKTILNNVPTAKYVCMCVCMCVCVCTELIWLNVQEPN